MKKIVISLMFAFLIQSCVPTLIGGAFYGSAKNKQAKAEVQKTRTEFMSKFNEQNMEREHRHLKPLNIDEEISKFDPAWAAERQRDVFAEYLRKLSVGTSMDEIVGKYGEPQSKGANTWVYDFGYKQILKVKVKDNCYKGYILGSNSNVK